MLCGPGFGLFHYKFSYVGFTLRTSFGVWGLGLKVWDFTLQVFVFRVWNLWFLFCVTKFSCLGFGFEPWRFGYGLFHHKFLYLWLGIRNCDFEFFKIIDCLVLVYKNIILNLKLKQKWWSHRLFCCLANGFPFRHGRFCALRRVVTNKSTSSRWILYSAPF